MVTAGRGDKEIGRLTGGLQVNKLDDVLRLERAFVDKYSEAGCLARLETGRKNPDVGATARLNDLSAG